MSGDKLPIVAQEDRAEAAEIERSKLALWPDIAEKVADLTLAGKRDDAITCQAFARHRITAETKAATTITELVSVGTEMADLIERITDAVDREAEDIGGESSMAVLREMGANYARFRTALSNTRGDKNEQE